MKTVYLDHASTSFPKAPGVAETLSNFIGSSAYNVSRGVYRQAHQIERQVLQTRQALADLFNFQPARNIVFCGNVTMALNLLLKGFLKTGDHVITSSIEHNAVMRPLHQLQEQGIRLDIAVTDARGCLDPQKIEDLIRPETRLVILTAASNVCGTVLPLAEVGDICHRHQIDFFVDAAQGAGLLTLDMVKLNISALAFTGHKSLLGPQGIGGFLLAEHLVNQIEPLISGGTGSYSATEEMPAIMPDRFEAGTLNLPGIIGLNQALNYIRSETSDVLLRHNLELTRYFIEQLDEIQQLKLIGLGADACDYRQPRRLEVVSIDCPEFDNAQIADRLEHDFGISTRCGLHCAPRAHRTLGTFPQGTIRFSFGHSTEKSELDYALDALRQCLNG